jgi:hypothetical protein
MVKATVSCMVHELQGPDFRSLQAIRQFHPRRAHPQRVRAVDQDLPRQIASGRENGIHRTDTVAASMSPITPLARSPHLLGPRCFRE